MHRKGFSHVCFKSSLQTFKHTCFLITLTEDMDTGMYYQEVDREYELRRLCSLSLQ